MSVALFLLPESAPLPLSDLIKYWNLYRFGGDNLYLRIKPSHIV